MRATHFFGLMGFLAACDDPAAARRLDAVVDAAPGVDAVVDAGVDAVVDAGVDAALVADAALDVGADAALDAAVDAGPPLPIADVRALIEPWIEAGWFPSVSVALIRGDQVAYLAFGTLPDGPPDADTVYEVGSITKTFTGLLLADAIERGEVALDDPVQDLLPEGVTVPSRDGVEISLGHLVTHHAGFPHYPANLPHLGEYDRDWADYTPELLYDYLRTFVLPRPPGTAFEYSNVGAGLLGHALALQAGEDYATLLARRVTEPLGLSSTGIGIAGDRFAHPEHADGRPAVPFDMYVLEGAGNLRSTARDLIAWIRAWSAPESTPLAAPLARAQAPLVTVDALNQMAYFWFIQGPVLWHGGWTYGACAEVFFAPEQPMGVVLLANRRSYVAERLAVNVLRVLADAPPLPLTPPPNAQLPPERLADFVGTYRYQVGTFANVILDGDFLYLTFVGAHPAPMHPESNTDFHLRDVPVHLHFEEADGQVTAMDYTDPNGTYRFRRVE